MERRLGIQGIDTIGVVPVTTSGAVLSAGLRYEDRVLATGPIAYWIQGEAAGLVAVDQVISPGQDGTYTGVTLGQPGIGDGNTSPLFDGANDYNDVFTATLRGRFDGSEGTFVVWARVLNAGVWTDGQFRRMISFHVDASNSITIYKSGGVNTMTFFYEGSNINELIAIGGLTSIGWLCFGCTWSFSAGVDGEFRAYINGAQIGLTQTALGAWVGLLQAATTQVGSLDQVPIQVWHGYLAHVGVWDRPLTPVEMLELGVL